MWGEHSCYLAFLLFTLNSQSSSAEQISFSCWILFSVQFQPFVQQLSLPYDYFIVESLTYGNSTEMLAALIPMKRNELLHYNNAFFQQLKVKKLNTHLESKPYYFPAYACYSISMPNSKGWLLLWFWLLLPANNGWFSFSFCILGKEKGTDSRGGPWDSFMSYPWRQILYSTITGMVSHIMEITVHEITGFIGKSP